ncbi:MAG TPA: SDR family oxidoreductase [Pirellulales bacterium]|jgi:short-subunit dehydrogenase|nr:SDR family oxidoreductase [Pirellulales bacterium]
MAQFSDRVIVITGASSGIGRALALELAPQHPKLVLAARDQNRLEEVAARCRQRGADVLVVPTDIAVQEQCANLIARAIERFGSLDVLVNNAGRAMWARFDELADLAVMEDIMRLNYLGSVHCTHFALAHLKQSRGLIVAIASASGLLGAPLLSGYAASKHAMIGFFESLRIELADSGVGVTLVAPDFVQSEILSRAVDARGQPLHASPLDQRKLMTAEACARRIVNAMGRRDRLLLTSARSKWARWGKLLAPKLVDWIAAAVVRAK